MPQKKTIISPDTKKPERIPPGQSRTASFPALHYGSVPVTQPSKWTFRMFGLVEQEKTLNYEEFTSLPQVELHCDIHCVTGWSRLDNMFEGVQALEVKRLVKIKPEAKFVMVHGENRFTTNLPIDDFFQEDVIFALKFDGADITPEHGYPVRLVVPRLYFWKSAKWVTGVEFMAKDKLGFWESYGYHKHGDPWTQERYGF